MWERLNLPWKATALPVSRLQVVFLFRQLLTFLPGKEAIFSWEQYTFPRKMSALPRLLLSGYTGREIALLNPLGPHRQGRVTTPPGQAGKVTGTPPGTGLHSLPRRPAQPPGKATPPPPPSRSNPGSSNEEPNPKWVINLSNKPLTPAQRSVLAKGPNFVVTPRQPPNLEYITAIEAACTKLSQQDAEELRADINRVLRSSHPPNPT